MIRRVTRVVEPRTPADLRIELLAAHLDEGRRHIDAALTAARALQREGRPIDPAVLVDALLDTRNVLSPPASLEGVSRG